MAIGQYILRSDTHVCRSFLIARIHSCIEAGRQRSRIHRPAVRGSSRHKSDDHMRKGCSATLQTVEVDVHACRQVALESGQRPTLARSGHAAAALPTSHTHDVIIFGGYTEDSGLARQATNEAWLYSDETSAWSPVQYSGSSAPQARLVTQAHVVGNHLIIIGGWDPGHNKDGGQILSDIWSLDLESYQWTELQPVGDRLQPTSRHQAVAVGHKIYIHTHRSIEDVLCLDLEGPQPSLSTIPIKSSAGSPASRGLHSMTAANGKLYIYGGAPKEGGMLGDLWELDVAQQRWEEVDADGQMPHVRCSHGASTSGDSIYFFGGSYYRAEGGLQPQNDLFAFDAVQRTWQHPASETSGLPQPRNAHSMTSLADGRLLIHGGWDPFKVSFNDTYAIEPRKLAWRSHIADEEL